MFKILVSLLFVINSYQIFAKSNIQNLKWGDLDVVYLKDNTLPLYEVTVYFADGALADPKHLRGLSKAALSMIQIGTRRYTQKEISENLEFFGARLSANVTHEYSTLKIAGLSKDVVPTMKKVCHLLRDANYPKKTLKAEKRRLVQSIKNAVTNHGALASRAFREVSLAHTPYEYPAGGKLKDINKWNQRNLKNQLNYFVNNVGKKLYITGPEEVLKIKNTLVHDCKFDVPKNKKWVYRSLQKNKKQMKNPEKITLVSVPKANQVQIRIGRFLESEDLGQHELITFGASFLGGGFTSKLMTEVRKKRGLSYSIGAVAASQKEYGRSFISTFTKNDKLIKVLEVIKNSIDELKSGKFTTSEFNNAKGYLSGGFPFSIQKPSDYIDQIIFYDHVGKDRAELYNFPNIVNKLTSEQVSKNISRVFNWDKMSIVVLGPKSVLKDLKTLGKVKVIPYTKFL